MAVIGSSPLRSTMVVGCLELVMGTSLLRAMVAGSSPVPATFIFLWCNGSTSDFGSEDRGSNPCRKTFQPVFKRTGVVQAAVLSG